MPFRQVFVRNGSECDPTRLSFWLSESGIFLNRRVFSAKSLSILGGFWYGMLLTVALCGGVKPQHPQESGGVVNAREPGSGTLLSGGVT